MTTERQDIPADVARSAVAWMLRLEESGGQSPDHARVLAQWQRWLTQSELHRQAWLRLAERDGQLRQLGQDQGPLLSRALAGAPEQPQAGRRRLLAGACVGVLGGIGAAVGWRVLSGGSADFRTAVGERRDIDLADGSRLMLDSDTAIGVDYTPVARRIALLRGGLYATVAQDGAQARPFRVEGRDGDVQTLAGEFSVRQGDGQSWLSVYAAMVYLQCRGGAATRIAAPGRAVYDRQAWQALPFDAQADAWRTGLLVADRMALRDFLAALARYRRGYLDCAPEVGGRLISGIYPLDDTDRALAAAARTLGLDIVTATRYWTRLQPPTA